MDVSRIPELVAAAKVEFADYINVLLRQYQLRRLEREQIGLPVLNFVGHGSCGKDTAAQYWADATGAKFAGTTSAIVAPMVAWGLGLTPAEAHSKRRAHRDYWYRWCNEFRKDDPSLLARLLLGQGDICGGTRGARELFASLEDGTVSAVVWIERPGIPTDPTMEFGLEDILKLPRPRRHVINNNQDKTALETSVRRIADFYSIKSGESHGEEEKGSQCCAAGKTCGPEGSAQEACGQEAGRQDCRQETECAETGSAETGGTEAV